MKPIRGYHGVFVDAAGRAEGLGLLWEAKAEVNLPSYSLHHIDATAELNGENLGWRFMGIYGWAKSHNKWRT